MMKRLLLVAATILVMLGVASAPSIAAPSSTEATETLVAYGWTGTHFTGTRISMYASTSCVPLTQGTVHSAALYDQTAVVELYSSSGCNSESLVAVLTAANPTDTGMNALGGPSLLGANGATHYVATVI